MELSAQASIDDWTTPRCQLFGCSLAHRWDSTGQNRRKQHPPYN